MQACFFCGKPATSERGDICVLHERKIMSQNAEVLRTQPPPARAASIIPPMWVQAENMVSVSAYVPVDEVPDEDCGPEGDPCRDGMIAT